MSGVLRMVSCMPAAVPATPRRPRAPFWPRVRRVTATVTAVTASVLSAFYILGARAYVPGSDIIEPDWIEVLGFLAGLAAAVALCWRHRHPIVITGLTLIPPLLLGTESLPALIALAALAANRRDRLLWIGTALVFLATLLAVERDAGRVPDASMMQLLIGRESGEPPANVPLAAVMLIAAIMTAIPVAVGVLRDTRRDLELSARQRERMRADLTRQDERARIARDMHDVLGHRLSLVNLQAGALEVSEGLPAPAAEMARSIRTAAGAALEDLRRVVGVLRDGGELDTLRHADAGIGAAEPALGDVPELIESTREAGLAVNITVLLEDSAEAPAELGSAVYRIIQESLTNVLRHAPGQRADVVVKGRPGVGVSVDVTNPMPTRVEVTRVEPESVQVDASTASSTGLVGITERVELLGGSVSAGPTDEGMFAVTAWVPWPAGE